MNNRSQRDFLNRGRKAGLSMHDLYSALSTLPPETNNRNSDQVDNNGYIATIDEQGHRGYRPHTEESSDQEPPTTLR